MVLSFSNKFNDKRAERYRRRAHILGTMLRARFGTGLMVS